VDGGAGSSTHCAGNVWRATTRGPDVLRQLWREGPVFWNLLPRLRDAALTRNYVRRMPGASNQARASLKV
jgi:hypothetical protein